MARGLSSALVRRRAHRACSRCTGCGAWRRPCSTEGCRGATLAPVRQSPRTVVQSRAMAGGIVRFGVAMDKPLLDAFDALVEARAVTRSELLRDLARAEIVRTQVAQGVPAAA